MLPKVVQELAQILVWFSCRISIFGERLGGSRIYSELFALGSTEPGLEPAQSWGLRVGGDGGPLLGGESNQDFGGILRPGSD